MALLADCHVHSHFSGDCDIPMEEMILSAIDKGMRTICFTEHNDFDFPLPPADKIPEKFANVPEQLSSLFELNADSYLFDLITFKEKYAHKIEVLFGVEVGLQKEISRKNIKFIKDYDFDFVIASNHLCHGQDPYYPEFFEGKSDEEVYREYFESSYENLRSFSNFDSYAHLDYIIRYGKTMDKEYSYAKYSDVIDKILQLLIDREKALELNTGGLRYGLKDMNPCRDIIKRYHDMGGELITIGSDSHNPAHIGSGFDLATSVLKDCGFGYYTVYTGRIPEQRKL